MFNLFFEVDYTSKLWYFTQHLEKNTVFLLKKIDLKSSKSYWWSSKRNNVSLNNYLLWCLIIKDQIFINRIIFKTHSTVISIKKIFLIRFNM